MPAALYPYHGALSSQLPNESCCFSIKCAIIGNCNRQKGSKRQEKRLKESGRNLPVNRRRQKTSPKKVRRGLKKENWGLWRVEDGKQNAETAKVLKL